MEIVEILQNKMAEDKKRQIVIPGEVIKSGMDFLPGENTEKRGDDIVALRYGLSEENNNLVKVLALSGKYIPRRGNTVIGKVEMITFNGWVIDIGMADNAFLSLMEVPRFVNKNALNEVMDLGDMVVANISSVNKRGTDLTLKDRGLGKFDEGMVIQINPNKVPRIIGKEGSMIKLIKDQTGCSIIVGQNGFIWIQGDTIEDELLAKKAMGFISENSHISGLTDAVAKWFAEEKK
jgi:exosome complex component RRP4